MCFCLFSPTVTPGHLSSLTLLTPQHSNKDENNFNVTVTARMSNHGGNYNKLQQITTYPESKEMRMEIKSQKNAWTRQCSRLGSIQ